MAMTTLQWPDYVIFVVFLGISLGIGFYHSVTGGRQRTTQEFLMANRKLGILPTAMSLFISFVSAIMILGTTVEMYQFGIQFLVWCSVCLTCAIVLAERLLVPWIYPLKLVSINDYLEQRFESRAVRVFGSVGGILTAIMYMGVVMFAPSAALESATGLPMTTSIPLLAVVAITYTTMGGMRAVIWTDVFQFLIFSGGLLAILIKGLNAVGGVQNVFDICYRDGRLQASNWSFDPTVRQTVWGFLIGGTVSWVALYGLNQASVQRYSATESIVKARITVLINIPALLVLFVVVGSIGLTVYAYYARVQCDPFANNDITNPNQVLSLFVTTIFSDTPGFSGLFLSTLYGGALSTISSVLSGCAANCWDDILKWKLDGIEEQRKTLLNRLLVVAFGFIAAGVAFLAVNVPGPIIQISTTLGDSVSGPIYGVYLLAGLSRHANWKGALAGGVGSAMLSAWLSIGALNLHRSLPTLPPTSTQGCIAKSAFNGSDAWNNNSADELMSFITMTSPPYKSDVNISHLEEPLSGIQYFYATSYLWYSLFGIINACVIGIIVSLIFRDREAEARVDDRLLIPFHKLFTWSETEPSGTVDGRTDEQIDMNKADISSKQTDDNVKDDVERRANGSLLL